MLVRVNVTEPAVLSASLGVYTAVSEKALSNVPPVLEVHVPAVAPPVMVPFNGTTSSDSIMETLLVADAAKRAGCNSFTLVAPYQGYSRQDKTDHLRSSIGSKVLADILEKVGVSRIITIDLHASAIQGFYNNLYNLLK